MLRLVREAARKVRGGGGGGSLLQAWSTSYGEAPAVTFQDCLDAYLKDPACRAFVDFLADQTVGMGFYTSLYVQSQAYGGKALQPERIIHWRWNPVNGEAFGSGLLRTLLERLQVPGGSRMSFLEMKARIERIMPEIIEKYAGPDELWVFEGVSEDQLAEYQKLIKGKPKAGARFVYNKPADIKTVQVDPRARFEAYIEHIWNQFIIGGETPIPKLISTPGFTEASARATMEVAERKVMALQRFIKRIVEREIFAPIVEQAGYDPKRALVRLNWGIPEKPEINMADVLKAAEQGLISQDEFRNIVRKIGWELKEPS